MRISILCLLGLGSSCVAFAGPSIPNPSDFKSTGQEIVRVVRENFYDPKQAADWAKVHENYGVQAKDVREFARLTNGLLAELRTSHTHYYTPYDPEYYMLLAIFQAPLKISSVEYAGIGADFRGLRQGFFIASIFSGSPAEKSGLKRGDRVVRADGKEFDPYLSFKDRAGKIVTLTVERQIGQSPIEIRVTPRRINPKQEWLKSQRAGSRIIERNGRQIAYADLWSCAGEEHQQALQDSIADSFQQADALILDFRNGWGGCNPEFLNIFNPYVPVFTQVDHRTGKKESADPQWRKPLFVLINGGTRSGKELVAFAIKKHKLGTLIGERTAGAVMAGKLFLLSDKSLLYLAVKDGLVDGIRLEGMGVEPDAPVADSLPYANGRDPQLEKALDLACGIYRSENIDVRHVASLINAKGNGANILGQDAAYSIDLDDGAMWLFGDTFYGAKKDDGSLDIKGAVNNNAAWSQSLDASNGIFLSHVKDAKGNAGHILANVSSEDPKQLKLWPGHGVKVGDRIYLFYSLVEVFGPGSWDFRHAGQGLAVGREQQNPFSRLTYDGRYDLWRRAQPRFGVAVMKRQEEWIYVYGRDESKPYGFKLARVRGQDIENPSRYQYLSRAGADATWTQDISKAANLFDEGPPEASVSYNAHLGKFLMLYSRFMENDVVMRTAETPWGPWSEPRSIYRCVPSKPDANCYAAKEHPEYAKENGRKIYFTVVDGGKVFGGSTELFEIVFHGRKT